MLKEILGADVCTKLMFVHAYSGCASTSRIFGIGKKAVFHKLLKSDPLMKACASTFILGNNSSDDISDLGKGLMISLFGGTLSSRCHFQQESSNC